MPAVSLSRVVESVPRGQKLSAGAVAAAGGAARPALAAEAGLPRAWLVAVALSRWDDFHAAIQSAVSSAASKD
jgi:hypothetical protein